MSQKSEQKSGNTEERQPQTSKNSVVLKALIMSAGTFSSRILGLVREMLFGALFDRTITDAFTAAFKLPNLFRRLLGEGSLSVSFQPIYIEAQVEDERTQGQRARLLMDSMHLFLVILLTTLTVGGIVFASQILGLILDADYVQRVEAFQLTVRMAQIMFGFLFFICLYAYYMAILNANGIFGWPAVAPVFFNISLIISTLLPPEILPVKGDTLAWGVLVGGFLQMAVLIRPLQKLGYFPRLQLQMGNGDLLRVLRNMLPGLMGLALMQITLIVNMRFASALGKGAISYINWADRLLELPLSLISVSLGTALLPVLSTHWARHEKDKMVEVSERTLSLNLFVGAMAAVGLYVLAEPIVRLLFERGRFTEEDSRAVISVVEVYAMTLIPVSGVRVLAPSFYAAKNTWYPAVIAGVGLFVHILIAPGLMEWRGLVGLNLSSFVSASLNFAMLLLGFNFLLTHFLWKRFWMKCLKAAVAAAVMGLATTWISGQLVRLLTRWSPSLSEGWPLWLAQLTVAGSLGVGLFLMASFIIKHDDVHTLIRRIRERIKRSK